MEWAQARWWDGSALYTQPNIPWFLKTLSETTTENFKLRVCGKNATTTNEDASQQVIELFVHVLNCQYMYMQWDSMLAGFF